MEIRQEVSASKLGDMLWSGGKEHWNWLLDLGASEDAIMSHLEEVFPDGADLTAVNDYIWFDSDSIREYLGLVNWDEDFPDVDLSRGINILIDRFHDSDIDGDERKNNTDLLNAANDLEYELDKCKREKKISDKLKDLIEKVRDLDEDLLFDLDDLEEFIEKVDG